MNPFKSSLDYGLGRGSAFEEHTTVLDRQSFSRRPSSAPGFPYGWEGPGPGSDLSRGLPDGLPTPSDLREIAAFIKKHRSVAGSFDIVNIGWTTGVSQRKDAEKVASFIEAGMTWWLESLYTKRDSPERMRARIRQMPPTGP